MDTERREAGLGTIPGVKQEPLLQLMWPGASEERGGTTLVQAQDLPRLQRLFLAGDILPRWAVGSPVTGDQARGKSLAFKTWVTCCFK